MQKQFKRRSDDPLDQVTNVPTVVAEEKKKKWNTRVALRQLYAKFGFKH